MFLDSAEYQRRQGELRRALARLRQMPEEIIALLRDYAGEAEQVYRLSPELRSETWQKRLSALQESGEARIEPLRREAEQLYQRAQDLANQLAVTASLPESEQARETFTTTFALAVERLRVHCGGFSSDDATAQGLRQLREGKVLERDSDLARAAWLFIGELIDTRQGWNLTESEWRSLEPYLPDDLRELVALARELANGYARLSVALAQAGRYIRNTAMVSVYIPLWRETDNVVRVDAVNVQRLSAAV